MDSIRNLIINDSITFEKAAKDFSEDKITNVNGGFLQDDTGDSRLSVEQLDPNTFFTIDTMQVGDISTPIIYKNESGKDAVRIVYYKDSVKPHQANLKQDWSKILNAALNEKKRNVLNDWFDKSRYEVFIQIDDEYNYCNIMH
jgi:peptidyl-prolyl cis-trans isomerase SurA